MHNVLRLQNEHLECASRMNAIYQRAKAERRELHPNERAEFDACHQQAERLKQSIQILESRGATNMTNNLTLPVNGRLPGEQREWTPDCSYKLGTLKCFRGPDADRRAYAAGMWLRCFIGQHWNRPDQQAIEFINRLGWTVTNAAGEGSGASGGYLVPAPLSNAIIEHMERVGVARQVFDIQPMTADTLSIPKRAGGLNVYYVQEAGTITDSDKSWRQIELVAKKRAVASLISSELVDDALINVVDNVFKEMGHALALRQDQETIAGDGTSTYGGVQGLLGALGAGGVHTAASGHDTWGELDLADFTAMMGKLPDKYHAMMPSFICSSAFYFGVMLRILAAAGGNTIAAIQGGDGGSRNFLGYRVHLAEAMPKTTAASQVSCLFGAFNAAAVLGERLGVRIARSDDYRFLNDQTALKATTRYDFKIHESGTDSVAGAYVGLSTAAN